VCSSRGWRELAGIRATQLSTGIGHRIGMCALGGASRGSVQVTSSWGRGVGGDADDGAYGSTRSINKHR
jgi:hypothetical protein